MSHKAILMGNLMKLELPVIGSLIEYFFKFLSVFIDVIVLC